MDWEKSELEEQISQAATLIKRLLDTPDDCELRNVCEGWLSDHKSYIPDNERGYDISKLDGDVSKLNF